MAYAPLTDPRRPPGPDGAPSAHLMPPGRVPLADGRQGASALRPGATRATATYAAATRLNATRVTATRPTGPLAGHLEPLEEKARWPRHRAEGLGHPAPEKRRQPCQRPSDGDAPWVVDAALDRAHAGLYAPARRAADSARRYARIYAMIMLRDADPWTLRLLKRRAQ